MKYLSPDIAKLAQGISDKKLAKIGTSCGIFQDCFDNEFKYKKPNKIEKTRDVKQPRWNQKINSPFWQLVPTWKSDFWLPS